MKKRMICLFIAMMLTSAGSAYAAEEPAAYEAAQNFCLSYNETMTGENEKLTFSVITESDGEHMTVLNEDENIVGVLQYNDDGTKIETVSVGTNDSISESPIDALWGAYVFLVTADPANDTEAFAEWMTDTGVKLGTAVAEGEELSEIFTFEDDTMFLVQVSQDSTSDLAWVYGHVIFPEGYAGTAAAEKEVSPETEASPKESYSGAEDQYCASCDGLMYCDACGGLGDCDSCFGEGVTWCQSCSGTGDCGSCYGQGGELHYVFGGDNEWRDCSRCDGSGICTRCDGIGDLDCTACDGRGSCRVCDGTALCSSCGGSGML